MSGWSVKRLIDFWEFNPKINVNNEDEYSFIEMPDLVPGNKQVLPSRKRRAKGLTKFQNGDTLFAKITPCLENGKICQAQGLENNVGVGSTEFFVFRGKEGLSDNDFIHYLLKWYPIRKYAEKCMSGSAGHQRVPSDAFDGIELPLPDFEEGVEIAKILSSLDKKITLLHQQNQSLEELAQTLFKSWFVEFEFPNENGEPYKSSGGKMFESELGEIPEGWRVGRFDEIIEFNNGYAFSSKELLDEPTQSSLDVFKMGHIIKGGGFNPSKSKSFIEREKCQELEKYILKKGDLLMCMTDMKDNTSLLGHTALMPVGDKFIVNQRVGLIRARNDIEIKYPYLYILTNSKDFLAEIRSRANSGVQVNLSTNGIKETETLIATKEVNMAFDNVASRLFGKVLSNQEEIQTAARLRDTLLPKLMSGQVNVENN